MRSRPVARDTDTGIDTDGVAFAIPFDVGRITQIKLKVSADAYVGMGSSSTVPAASADNSTYQDTGELIYTLDGVSQLEGYLYVYAQSGTINAFVSYYA